MGSLKETARAYAAKDKAIFPVHSVTTDGQCTCGNPDCDNPGKHPRTKNGLNDASPNSEQVHEWWTRWPSANIGLATGNGIFVLDVDLPDGPESLAALEREHAPLPETLEQRTGSGGRHLFFSTDTPIRNSASKKLGKNLDIRGDGGYVILPPSIHQNGQHYAWGDQKPVAEAPEWLIERLVESKGKVPLEPTNGDTKAYGQKALADELAELAGAEEGSRNDRLNQAAFSLGQLVAGEELGQGQVASALLSASAEIGLSESEARKTINSGLESGKREPRKAPEKHPHKTLSTLKTQEQKTEDWEEPLLFGEIQTPDIKTSLLPGWLGDYAGAIARTTQTPPGMATMLSLSVAATCLQKRFVIAPYAGEYVEPLNLWAVTALPPASRKTAVIGALTEPLQVWEREQSESLADEIARTRNKRKINLARIEKLTKKAANIDDPIEREALLYEIAETEKDTPEEIRPPRLWTGDVTPERLQSLLVEHGECMALLSDEAGIFEVMAGLYTDGKVNLDVFLQAHAGKSVRVDRTSRTAHLDAPALTFGLAVQPSMIADLSQGSKKRFRGNGALARFLYCLPKNNIGKRDVRKRESISEGIKAAYSNGINLLLSIEPKIGQDGRQIPYRLELDKQALEYWLAFSESIEVKQGPNGEYEPIQDWTGKLPGAALRIAGLFHVVEHGLRQPLVNHQTMEKALDLSELLVGHAQAAFDLMGVDQVTEDARAIFDWISSHNLGRFTKTDVRRALKGRWTKAERLNRALDDLLSREITGEPYMRETEGRSALTYPVNPYLSGRTAA